jgi:probable HAF family extracellular repeat protein
MRSISYFGLLLSAGLLITATASPASGQATYTITDLGTLPGGSYSFPYAINNSGQVTGFGGDAAGQIHAFLYSSGAMTDLGTLPGDAVSLGYAINDATQVVGESRVNSSSSAGLGFLYSSGTMTSLGTLPGDIYSLGLGINNFGQITGFSSPSAGTCCAHAYVYINAVMSDIGTLSGGSISGGFAINRFGQITGYSDGANFMGQHAFLYSNGSMMDLGVPAGDNNPDFLGVAINDASQIAVNSTNNFATFGRHAYLYTGGQFVPLGTLPGGTLSYAEGIGNTGQVVGYADGAGFSEHAFLYSNGQMTDLNTQIPANSGWTLSLAVSINNAGQVAGWGTIGSAVHAYLLTPPTAPGLTVLTQSLNLPSGTANSFLTKLLAAEAAGPGRTACSDYNDFIAEVKAQSGKKLMIAQANQLIATATQVEVAQGCN